MKKTIGILVIVVTAIVTAGLLLTYFTPQSPPSLPALEKSNEHEQLFSKNKEEEKELDRGKMKAQRLEYFFRLLRDPKTNSIPQNIRKKELNLARQQPTRVRNPIKFKSSDGATLATADYSWVSAGPRDVGGRTRALGIDSRNSDIVIAGGVSGGVWKSTDGGTSWDLKTDPSQNQSVTSLVQDPTSRDTWYYTSGEFRGQSAADRGNTSFYWGDGVYKSTDNGETWNLLPNASSSEDQLVDKFNTISRIVVNPRTGSIFIASNGFGIYRSVDDGNTFPSPPVLGSEREQYWADIDAVDDGSANGRLIATLSSQSFDGGSTPYQPGVFVSYDDGNSWTNVTPSSFPSSHERSVVTFAPSAPDTAYVLTYVDGTGSDEDVRFHFIDLNTGGSKDRTSSLPDFGGSVGYMSTQQNYNMEVAVKPDDPELVLVGGINLFRSFDGFKTEPTDSNNDGVDDTSEKDTFWIGGYSKENNISQYPGQHADQHVITFDPSNPDITWAGHDGGLSRTTNITANSVEWNNKDQGYITTQFYAVDIPDNNSDQRLVGGTQDNGSLFFRYNSQNNSNTAAADLSTGDGSYAFFTNSYIFASRQNGDVIRYLTDASNEPVSFAFVHPADAQNQFFIHPYAIDPTDETIMYYPDQRSIWRNTAIDEIGDNNEPDGVTKGWESFQVLNTTGYSISALEVTTSPTDILYIGASSDSGVPKLFRLNNASTSTSAQDISFSGAPAGGYVHDFAINPSDGDEVMAIFSNYNVSSIYYTDDGGSTWQNIEGNLEGNAPANAGPSVRSGGIIPTESGNVYVVGTSTGLYSTTTLEETSTQWVQESPNAIGHAVTEFVATNALGTIAAGTHGRGIFKGTLEGSAVNIPIISADPGSGRAGSTVALSATNFSFNTNPGENDVTFNGVPAEVTDATSQNLDVIVPRGTIPPGRQSNIVEIRTNVDNVSASTSFEILPPKEFDLLPNYPNPFNPTTNIPFDLPSESGVIIQIYDMSGRKVLEPVRKVYQPNTYNIPVDMSGLASGVYFYRVVVIPRDESGRTTVKSRKMTLIK